MRCSVHCCCVQLLNATIYSDTVIPIGEYNLDKHYQPFHVVVVRKELSRTS